VLNIGIIGAGVIGTATGIGFHNVGFNVSFYDISNLRLSDLRSKGYSTHDNVYDVISENDILFICVNVPTLDNGKQDFSQIHSVIRSISPVLEEMKKHKLLVFRSTMLPGSMKGKVMRYLEECCSLEVGKDYDVCYNPEFLRQANALEDFLNPDRVVVGEERKNSSIQLQHMYKEITKNVIVTDYETAEMIKYASNCFLSLKISYFNQLGDICKRIGIDDRVVGNAVSLDKRIGDYGTRPGKPYGGACLPKDTFAFANFIDSLQIEPNLVKIVQDINENIAKSNRPNNGAFPPTLLSEITSLQRKKERVV
jgi:UDPglucose 6-dehydrogenase